MSIRSILRDTFKSIRSILRDTFNPVVAVTREGYMTLQDDMGRIMSYPLAAGYQVRKWDMLSSVKESRRDGILFFRPRANRKLICGVSGSYWTEV